MDTRIFVDVGYAGKPSGTENVALVLDTLKFTGVGAADDYLARLQETRLALIDTSARVIGPMLIKILIFDKLIGAVYQLPAEDVDMDQDPPGFSLDWLDPHPVS